MNSKRTCKILLFTVLCSWQVGCKTVKSNSEILEEPAVDAGTTPSEHVDQGGATGQNPEQEPAKPVPTNQPSGGQTQHGDGEAKDRVEKGDDFVAKAKEWWREMFDFVRSIGDEKPMKDQSIDELKESIEEAAKEYKAGNPIGMLKLRDLNNELAQRYDPNARAILVNYSERGDIVITETLVKGTEGQLDFNTSVNGNGSAEVDLKAAKTKEELSAEVKSGSRYTLDSKNTVTRSYRQQRLEIRIITTEKDGSTAENPIFYLESQASSNPWNKLGNILETDSPGLFLRDIDREPSCRCSHCRSDSELPVGYYCKERHSCNDTMCSKWEPVPPKTIYVDLWYYPESKVMVRRLPAFEAADRELEHTLYPRINVRIRWLTAALKSLEDEYRSIEVINAKSRNVLKSVEAFVKKSPVDFDQARALDASIRTQSTAACSSKSLMPIVNDVKSFKASVDDMKPDFDRVIAVLETAGENRQSLEVNWTNWTLPFADINARISTIEKEEKANYCGKMQAAIDAVGAKLDQERINTISTELLETISILDASLKASKATMIFVAMHDQLMFEGLKLAEKINRSRLKREYSRANVLIEQAKQWMKQTETQLDQSPLSLDQRNLVRKDATSMLEKRISEWDQMRSEAGQEGILNRRIFKLGKKLPKVLSAIKKMPEPLQSNLIASWRDRVSEQGFVIPAQCFLKEHEQQPYCWQLERQNIDSSLDVYDRRLDAFDYLMDSYILEIAVPVL